MIDPGVTPALLVQEYNHTHGVPSSGGFRLATHGESPPEEEDELKTLERLLALREKGVLTEEEHAARKAQVLGS
jgi:hypothetical protein